MKVIRVTSAAVFVLMLGAVAPTWAQRDGEEKQEEKRPQQHAQQPQQRVQEPQRQREHQAPPQAAERREQQQRAEQAPPQQEPQRSQEPRQDQPRLRAQQAQQQPARDQREQRTQQSQQQQRVQDARQQRQRPEQEARSWQQHRGWAQQGGGVQGHSTFAQDRSQNWSSEHRSWAQRGGYGGYFIPQDTFRLSFGSQHFFRLGGVPSMYMGYPRFSDRGFSFLIVDPWPGDWSENWYSSDDVYVDYNDDGYYLYNRRYPQERLAITIIL